MRCSFLFIISIRLFDAYIIVTSETKMQLKLGERAHQMCTSSMRNALFNFVILFSLHKTNNMAAIVAQQNRMHRCLPIEAEWNELYYHIVFIALHWVK